MAEGLSGAHFSASASALPGDLSSHPLLDSGDVRSCPLDPVQACFPKAVRGQDLACGSLTAPVRNNQGGLLQMEQKGRRGTETLSSGVQQGSPGVAGGPLPVQAGEPQGLPALEANTLGQVLPSAVPG